jgi:hypothetical protein
MPVKYLYLKQAEWAATWQHGGEVPIKLASAYRGLERKGTQTPDENNLQEALGASGEEMELIRRANLGPGALSGLLVRLPGGRVLTNVHAEFATWDGYILCFANSVSHDDWEREGKQACVVVEDTDVLLKVISEQLGLEGQARECSYTEGASRDVFTKSVRDSWQNEFRMYWPGTGPEQRVVVIPPGTARLLWVSQTLNGS